MAKRDYYEVLGVDRTASDAELKKAYRRLAMKYHPDRNSGDVSAEKHFKEAKEAYEMLSDAQKRSAFDQFGHAGVDSSAGTSGAGAAGVGDVFGDIFGDIFGGGGGGSGGRRRGTGRGADMQYALELSLEDAVHGTESRIRVPSQVRCETCSGSGARPGTTPSSCSTCAGQGQVRMQQGFFSIQQTCPDCRGRGTVISSPCSDCHGNGTVQKTKTLQVKVPAGVDDGDQIRLAGEGQGSTAGSSGDLYVQIRIRQHPIFSRDGDNLYCEMPVSVAMAALGGEIEIPTLNGRAQLKIPPESQSERVFRLRSKGVRNVRSSEVGDLYCKIKLEIPVKLNRKQKDILREFDRMLKEGGERHTPRESSWSDRMKSFFNDIVT
ncbi:MAG: molecular chaperone DnaJ [Arenicellales bacterium]